MTDMKALVSEAEMWGDVAKAARVKTVREWAKAMEAWAWLQVAEAEEAAATLKTPATGE